MDNDLRMRGTPKVGELWHARDASGEDPFARWTYQIVSSFYYLGKRYFIGVKANPNEPWTTTFDENGRQAYEHFYEHQLTNKSRAKPFLKSID